jgi:hypothetical protein
MFPLEFIPRYGAEDGGLKGAFGDVIPARFSMNIALESTSSITNLFVNHEQMYYERDKEDNNVFVKIERTQHLKAKDIVISYKTEGIRKPQISLISSKKYPNEVAVHISFIPRTSENADSGKFYSGENPIN